MNDTKSATKPAFLTLARGKSIQIAYRLTLLDLALIRSNAPDETLSRNIMGQDYFVIPASKTRHAMRGFLEAIQHTEGIEIGEQSCRAQHYCSACPACLLFGTLGVVGDNKKTYSLASQVSMTEAIAVNPGAQAVMRTCNAVDPATMKTNTSLNSAFYVPEGTEFYGTILIKSTHPDVARIVMSALTAVTRIGASTAKYGLCEVEILAVREGFVEDTSWAPQRRVATGIVPTSDQSPSARMVEGIGRLVGDAEDALIASLRRFHEASVVPLVAKLSGPVAGLSTPVGAVLKELALAEGNAAKGTPKLLKALDKLMASADIKASDDALRLLATAREHLASKVGNVRNNVSIAAQGIRDALALVGCAKDAAAPVGA